jgi:hypothetical protein
VSFNFFFLFSLLPLLLTILLTQGSPAYAVVAEGPAVTTSP